MMDWHDFLVSSPQRLSKDTLSVQRSRKRTRDLRPLSLELMGSDRGVEDAEEMYGEVEDGEMMTNWSGIPWEIGSGIHNICAITPVRAFTFLGRNYAQPGGNGPLSPPRCSGDGTGRVEQRKAAQYGTHLCPVNVAKIAT